MSEKGADRGQVQQKQRWTQKLVLRLKIHTHKNLIDQSLIVSACQLPKRVGIGNGEEKLWAKARN